MQIYPTPLFLPPYPTINGWELGLTARNELWLVVKSKQQTLQSTAAAARPLLDKILDMAKPTCILQKAPNAARRGKRVLNIIANG